MVGPRARSASSYVYDRWHPFGTHWFMAIPKWVLYLRKSIFMRSRGGRIDYAVCPMDCIVHNGLCIASVGASFGHWGGGTTSPIMLFREMESLH